MTDLSLIWMRGVGCLGVCLTAMVVWWRAYPKWPLIAVSAKLAFAGALAALVFVVVPVGAAQEISREEARGEARELAAGLETQLRDGARQTVDAESVPGFVTASPPAAAHYSSPEALESTGLAELATSEASEFVLDSMAARPVVTAEELQTWTEHGLAIQSDAQSIVAEYTGAYGDCETVITGGTRGLYTYVCNEGETLLEFTRSCAIPLTVTLAAAYGYSGEARFDPDICDHRHSETLERVLAHADCGPLSVIAPPGCGQAGNSCGFECGPALMEAVCTSPVPGLEPEGIIYSLPATDELDASACAVMEADAHCALVSEVCIEPAEARWINGIEITRDCWGWSRTYQCAALGDADDDCSVPAGCVHSETVCLSEDEETGACRNWEHIYGCETVGIPGGAAGYCEEDVYCIAGDCEPLIRPQNDEFHQAVSAMGLLGQLEEDADAGTLEVFPGDYSKCDKAIAGLQNCCRNNGLLTDIGFGCSADDIALANQVGAGLCHYTGSYCSDRSFFGICLKSRQTYCCFNSLLARLIHEQGRPQVGWSWGTARSPDCSGFTVALFQQLDFSVMDLSEFYADVLEGFAPPDGAATAGAIIQRIINAHACPPDC